MNSLRMVLAVVLAVVAVAGCKKTPGRRGQSGKVPVAVAAVDAGLAALDAGAGPVASTEPLDRGVQKCQSWGGEMRPCKWCTSMERACFGLTAGWRDGDEVFAVGGGIAHSADGGKHWDFIDHASIAPTDPDITTSYLTSVWGSSADDVYVVGCNAGGGFETPGIILHSADRGKSWQVQRSDIEGCLRTVIGSGPDEVFAIGSLIGDDDAVPLILRNAGGGKQWKKAGKQAPQLASPPALDDGVRASADAAFDHWITTR